MTRWWWYSKTRNSNKKIWLVRSKGGVQYHYSCSYSSLYFTHCTSLSFFRSLQGLNPRAFWKRFTLYLRRWNKHPVFRMTTDSVLTCCQTSLSPSGPRTVRTDRQQRENFLRCWETCQFLHGFVIQNICIVMHLDQQTSKVYTMANEIKHTTNHYQITLRVWAQPWRDGNSVRHRLSLAKPTPNVLYANDIGHHTLKKCMTKGDVIHVLTVASP